MSGRSTSQVAGLIRRAGVQEVDDSTLTRGLYSTDASLYRVVPDVVVRPRDTAEILAVLDACREAGAALTARGAGTSVAGNAVGAGVVLDLSRHLRRIVEIDAEAGRAVVEPGVVHRDLQRAVAAHGLRFGPDPSSGSRCTIGGMVGNNACGTRALAYGRTSDNVLALDVAIADGHVLRLGADQPPEPRLVEALGPLVSGNLATIRTQFGGFARQSSGYALEHLLPERGFDVARALVGSEGTLGVVTRATVRLVRAPRVTRLVVLGFADLAGAADAVLDVLAQEPTACEGLDSRIVTAVRERRGAAAVPPLPRGQGWLFVEVAGETEAVAEARVGALTTVGALGAMGAIDHLVVHDPAHAAALWQVRADGAGRSGVSPAGRQAHAGWEDAAVPPQHLGSYLRAFDDLVAGYGLTCMPYGHFGDGCVHARLDFRLDQPDGAVGFRSFLLEAAHLVVGFGGSLSGEHGDGRARSELLALMYPPEAVDLMAQVKAAFDPTGMLNPGVIVGPAPLDRDLRATQLPRRSSPLPVTLAPHDGDLVSAVHRCTGVGSCRADPGPSGGVMCPSYVVTRDEKDSTRGRARALQEMFNGTLFTQGWRSPEVHEALDLCLSCKGCLTDCPTGIDMAAYKAEVLHQRYRRRLRPRAHYSLGWLPRWAAVGSRVPRLANGLLGKDPNGTPGPLGRVGRRLAGVDPAAPVPTFAARTFRSTFAQRPAAVRTGRPSVLLWVDTFTERFSPEVGTAAVALLEAAGFDVALSPRGTCCALTYISTGQLDAARRRLGRTVTGLTPAVRSGALIVGLEPSCTAVLRSEAVALVGTDEARAVAGAVRTVAELLAQTPGWQPPRLDGRAVVAQPHCHHSAVMGWDADAELLARTGAQVTRVAGCCGLAGNFGVEAGHRALSEQIAASELLPAIRAGAAGGGAPVVLADGFSCRLQVTSLTDVRPVHLAQLLTEVTPRADRHSDNGWWH